MSAEGTDFAELAGRFHKLGRADRRAVLAKFNPAERQALERRLAADAEARRRMLAEERRADRQFARYSPWLGSKVEKAFRGTAIEEGELTKACAAAVLRAHKAAEDAAEPSPVDTILQKLGLGSRTVPGGDRR